jgi:hypothetical protein
MSLDAGLDGRFGDPESLLRLATVLEQVSEGLWTVRKGLDAQVAALVPSGWEGPAAAAFGKHWEERSEATRQAAELARRMQSVMSRLGRELGAAKRLFQTGERLATSNGMWIQDTGVGYVVVNPNPWGWAVQTAAQDMVTTARAMANAAWLEARAELAIDTLPILGGLKDIGLGLVRAVDDLARLGLGAAELGSRFSPSRLWADPKGALDDATSGVKAAGRTLANVGDKLWTVLQVTGDLSPEMAMADPERFQQRSQEVGRAIHDWGAAVWDRPGGAITTTVEVGAGVFGPGLAAKGLRILKAGEVMEGLEGAAAAREAAAAEGVAANAGNRVGMLGAAGERARLTGLAQEGETAVDLNTMPSVGRGQNFPGWDNMSGSGIESVKVKMGPGYDPVPPAAELRAYRNDFRNLVDADRSLGSAEALLDSRNASTLQELQRTGAWPRDLPVDAPAQQVADYAQNSGRLVIPDDRVPFVRDFVASDIRQFPENYGLPEGITPSEAQVQQMTGRITGAGISTETVSRLVPNVLPAAP